MTEAEYRTAGDLILAMKTNPNKVLTLPGIGAKAIQSIEKAVSEANFAAPAPAVIEEGPAPAVEEVPATAAPVAVEVVEAQAAPQAPEPVAVVEEEADTLSFEEMFKLRPEAIRPVDEEESLDSKKKGKKGKKSVALEFDEDRGEVVGRKKHKRGDSWDDDW